WVPCLLQGARRGTCHACSRPSGTHPVPGGRVAGEPHWPTGNPGGRTDGGAHVTVESTAARTSRRSAGNKAGTTGTKRTTSTAKKAAGARKSTEPALVQLLTPKGKRGKNAEFDPYVAGITAEDLRGLYRDMVLTRRFDAEATALQRQGELGLWASLLGQEAAQIGSGRALRDDDYVFPTYREHGVAWCRGVD